MDRKYRLPELKKPKRVVGAAVPTLEQTLRYFALLLRNDISSHKQMALEIGMDERSLYRREDTEDWSLARKLAEQVKPRREATFAAYVFKQLSPEAQKAWESIRFWSNHKDASKMIEKLLHPHNRRVRQELFIHALVSTTFDTTAACRLACVSKDTLRVWREEDLEFCQLVEEVQWHKKNFFEKAMLDLVNERHPLATIWVNKTVNADRGYSEKIKVEHSINPDGFNFEDLDLDLETKRKILDAIRRKRELSSGTNGQPKRLAAPVVDVEAVPAHD